MSIAFFNCKSQRTQSRTISFSDSVCMYNNADDTVRHFIKDKFILTVRDSTLYAINNTQKKEYKIQFLYVIKNTNEFWDNQRISHYIFAALINNDTSVFSIAFYADDPMNRIHSFGMKVDNGKIYLIKLKNSIKHENDTNKL